MNQTKLESILEATLSVASGFALSLVIWCTVIIPVWDLEVTMLDNLTITAIFTVASVARSYFWRRFFNAEAHKCVRRFFQRGV